MKTCPDCGRQHKFNTKLCQPCWLYYKKGGEVYDLPSVGEQTQDDKGNYICHICGKSYVKLGNHVQQIHNMTILEYKDKFGLMRNCRTTNDDYHNKMHDLALLNGMDKQLTETGKDTRFKKNGKHKGKPRHMSLQEYNKVVIRLKGKKCQTNNG